MEIDGKKARLTAGGEDRKGCSTPAARREILSAFPRFLNPPR
jgi:hypothetical protein